MAFSLDIIRDSLQKDRTGICGAPCFSLEADHASELEVGYYHADEGENES
jgi:hypothetical protein